MTKREFLEILRNDLQQLPYAEHQKQMTYYEEIITDMMEDGMSEEEATAKIGDPHEVARLILKDMPRASTPLPPPEKAPMRKVVPWIIGIVIFLVIGLVVTVIAAAIFLGVRVIEDYDERHHTMMQSAELSNPAQTVSSEIMDEAEAILADASEENQYVLDASVSVDSIDVDWIAGSVIIAASDGNEISFSESSDSEFSGKELLQYSVLDEKLTISFCDETINHINLPEKTLVVFIPSELAAKIRSLDIDSVSADCAISGLSSGSIRFGSASGNLVATDMAAGTVRFDTVSGGILYEGSASNVYGNSVSGDVTMNLSSGLAEVEVETGSGNLEVSGSLGSVDADSTSGRVQIWCSSSLTELDAETTSGDITLVVPDDVGFELEFETVSGDFDCDVPSSGWGEEYSINGGGRAEYDAATVSGNLNIIAE